ncbi:MAG: hypothetical protein WCQ47_03330 [bacterium]
MKKLLIVLTIVLIPSLAFSASATVGGTLKVYVALSAAAVKDIVFPAQFVGSLAANLIDVDGAPAASGIPQVAPNLGQAGKVTFSGSGGTAITLTAAPTLSLTGPSTISAIPVTYYGEVGFTTLITTSATLSGSWGGLGTKDIYIKAVIPATTSLLAGTYTGTHTVTAAY